jgi:hypothetical protein
MIRTERRTDRGLLVTVCDDGLVGESFADGEVSLDVTESFYGGETVAPDAAVDSLERATVANLVGEETVALAVENGFVDPANVLDIEGTPHAQYLRL